MKAATVSEARLLIKDVAAAACLDYEQFASKFGYIPPRKGGLARATMPC